MVVAYTDCGCGRDTGCHVAVKVIKALQKYRDAAEIELRVLAKLKQRDVNGKRCDVKAASAHWPAPEQFRRGNAGLRYRNAVCCDSLASPSALRRQLTGPAVSVASSCCALVVGDFDYRNHVCLVFPLFGPSLYDHMTVRDYQGYPVEAAQVFTAQILSAVNCESVRGPGAGTVCGWHGLPSKPAAHRRGLPVTPS